MASHQEQPKQRRIARLGDCLRSSSLRVEVRSYCDNSSIHGVKYITERHRPNFERMIWSVTIAIAIVYAGRYTVDVWNETPIIKDEPIIHLNYRVPMPAITVCSNAKMSTAKNWGQERSKDMHTLRFVCGEAFPNSREISLKRFNETSPHFGRTCTLDIQDANGNLSQLECRSMFQRVVADQGICYSFNSYEPRHVYRSDIYVGDSLAHEMGGGIAEINHTCSDLPPDPLLLSRKPEPGVEDHLFCGNHTLKLSMFSGVTDSGYCTYVNETGFKILIHNPKDAPSVGIRRLIWTKEEPSIYQSLLIKIENKVHVKAEAQITSHSPELLWFNPKKRECFDERERELRYFKQYTKFNCLLECITNHTIRFCNCVDFYMPRLKTDKICTRHHLPCIFDVIDLFKKEKKNYCDCFPACYELNYIIQTRTYKDAGRREGIWNDTSLKLTLDLNVTEVVRRPSFTDLKVISSSGGVYGFFLGLSFISLVEILIYIFIRSISNRLMSRTIEVKKQ